jgi:hypothetical protein
MGGFKFDWDYIKANLTIDPYYPLPSGSICVTPAPPESIQKFTFAWLGTLETKTEVTEEFINYMVREYPEYAELDQNAGTMRIGPFSLKILQHDYSHKIYEVKKA